MTSVEIQKGDDTDLVAEDKAPIKGEVNGDVEGAASTQGGFDEADLDPADQTLAGDVSQDVDTLVIKDIDVSCALGFDVSFS